MHVLSASELRVALRSLPGWRRRRGRLERTFELKDFMGALRLVNRVGRWAERVQHHPDISIQWNRVTFSLTTHDAGGITEKDLELARQIDRLAARRD
ncbi:4a-hydroxytetrahydrobiopterin dehydratase [Limisphaera ngatamarikiensis]|jgi:4a-hydroxytetrahydrobiopterin dehydratase|uniref:Putative pterin-4-alpha-carbinolamine dehydratase n=1 Tax=Limisphaera ngatamarikiensis TaxID=1324935 RepID=A0A6M1RS50_9BACT|nr:4a-hydroxytetrahydrobiopterin dehydratase [Limisphaera ngatamarikiensis]NGO40227.1 4a-hydroxytetrahydrobiopterin dehydratase [Limisphaera ngatamarikiensis]